MQLRIFTPGKNRPRLQHRIEELYGRHVEMRRVAPRKEVQRARIFWTGINRPWTHGQPDRRRREFCAVCFGICEVCKSRPAKARGFDRISDSVLSGSNTDAYR